MKLQNKTILITGGSSGIGLAMAKALMKGNMIIITGRNKNKLDEIQNEYNDFDTIQCDVNSKEQIKSLAEYCQREYGGIDVLINNAGIFKFIDYLNNINDTNFSELSTNLIGPIQMVSVFLEQLRNSEQAAIINVSSALGIVPMSKAPLYSASKAALHSWTQSLRIQLKDTGIGIFEVVPPLTDTPATAHARNVKKLSPEVVAREMISGVEKGINTIYPGEAKMLKILARLAPSFIHKQINKQVA